jgi:hypothetical protein
MPSNSTSSIIARLDVYAIVMSSLLESHEAKAIKGSGQLSATAKR